MMISVWHSGDMHSTECYLAIFVGGMVLVDVINVSPADEQVLSDGTHGGVSVSESWHW